MRHGSGNGWAVLVMLAVSPSLAQETPGLENPYQLQKRKPDPERKALAARVEKALSRALVAKVAQCYQSEQGAKLGAEDQALLSAFGSELVLDLSSGLAQTSCKPEAASAECLKQLAALDCKRLAQPILSAGWDRHLTQAAKVQVAGYAEALARRDTQCKGYAADEGAIVFEVSRDRLAALVEMQIVTGQCQLFPDKLAACKAHVQEASCKEIADKNQHGELSQLCEEMFPCTIKNVDGSKG